MRAVMREGTLGVEDAFVALPRSLYAADPLWIPEEEASVRGAFDAANAWFERGRAATFCIPGRARLAVFRADGCAVDGRPAAFFGYLESVEDPSAAHALLARAEEWAREGGAEMLYGPIDFDTFGRYRLRTRVEDRGGLPFPGEPYGRPHYPALLERAGFSVAKRYLSQLSAGRLSPEPAQLRAAAALRAEGYAIEPLDGATWLALLPELHRRVDEIFADAYAYSPVSAARFAATHGAGVARRLCPQASVLARAPDGGVAGFLLVFPHYGPLVVQGTRLGRVGASALSYAEHAPRLAAAGERTAIVKSVGVAPTERRRGLMDAMVATMLERGAARYDRWIGALIRDDNPSRRFGDRHPRAVREYALWARPVARGIRGGSA